MVLFFNKKVTSVSQEAVEGGGNLWGLRWSSLKLTCDPCKIGLERPQKEMYHLKQLSIFRGFWLLVAGRVNDLHDIRHNNWFLPLSLQNKWILMVAPSITPSKFKMDTKNDDLGKKCLRLNYG